MLIGLWSDLHNGKRMYRTDETGYNKYEQIGYRVMYKRGQVNSPQRPHGRGGTRGKQALCNS